MRAVLSSIRINALRNKSVSSTPRLDLSRAKLVTKAHKLYEGKFSPPVLRAMIFEYICTHKPIEIYDDELLVGERGCMPWAAPTYPEICCHTLEDFESIASREKVFFHVSDADIKCQNDTIIPYWKERNIRDKMMELLPSEWHDCYNAGIFTEFMEQRAPGHTVADDKIYKLGIKGLIKRIDDELLDATGDAKQQLTAMRIVGLAICKLANRYSELAANMAKKAVGNRRAELKKIADICSKVPYNPAQNFYEALQSYWFLHIGVTLELNTWDSYSPGRLDQHLYPYFNEEDRDFNKELLGCFWIKFNNQPAPPKVGVTLNESGTYTDFCNINIGGYTQDGLNGVNPVSYLLLEVLDEMKLVQPSANIQLSSNSPDEFLLSAIDVIAKGTGLPSIFNADGVVKQLTQMGKTLKDAYDGGTSGCVEAGAFGKEAYILTGYFNLPKVLEITMHNGVNPKDGKLIGIKTEHDFTSFDMLMDTFKAQIKHFVDIKIAGNTLIEGLYAKMLPAPFLSLLTDDCIKTGLDYHAGGARYNTSYIQGVGIATVTDSLSAIKKHVFDSDDISFSELMDMLNNDFVGYERMRSKLRFGTPHYGNDSNYADDIMIRCFNMYHESIDGRKNLRGGEYHIDMLPTTCHVYFGSVTGATGDGRCSGKPLSEGISPVQGSDIYGPTAVIKSAGKMPHVRTGGTLLNQKLSPKVLSTQQGRAAVAALVRGYFAMGGHHLQFNVVDRDTLLAAQREPKDYRGLIVRVAGYSDYFDHLNKALQDEIIQRTQHEGI